MQFKYFDRHAGAIFVVAVFLGLIYLQSGSVAGRLAVDLQYDDVVYAVDAAQRISLIDQKGLIGFFAGLWVNPPHSPFSTLLAMLAFSVGGVNEFAMYASNILVLLGMTAFIVFEIRREGSSRAVQWGGALFLLVSPLASRVVCEFRPDIALGLVTAIMTILFFRGLVLGDSLFMRGASVAFGAALLVKPSFFAHTIAIAVGLLSLAAIVGLLRARVDWVPEGIRVRDGALFMLVGLALAFPYFVANGAKIAAYFYANTRGAAADIWSIPESAPLTLSIRTMWEYVGQISGVHVPLALGIGLISVIFLASKRDRAAVTMWVLLVIVAVSSFCIMVVGRHRNPYFLATFSWLVLLSGVISCAAAMKHVRSRGGRNLAFAAMMVLTVVAVLGASGRIQRWNDPQGSSRSSGMNVALVNTILADHAASQGNNSYPKVWIPFAGVVNADVMRWVSLKSNREMNFVNDAFTGDLEALQANARSADYLVLPNVLVTRIVENLQSAPFLPALLEWVATDPSFRPLSPLNADAAYYVFGRSDALQANGSTIRVVGGIASVEGFAPEEGPYPHWKLPRVRWMLQQEAKLCVVGKPGARYRVSLEMLRGEPGVLEVRSDQDVVMATRNVPQGDKATSIDFEMVAATNRACLRFLHHPEKTPASNQLVLFSQLHFMKAPQ